MAKSSIRVDVISDVVCPWCYIGKRRFEKAVAQLKEEIDFDIHYQPFQLTPDTPKEGYDQREHLTNKFGGPERYEQLIDHVSRVAETEGLHFNYAIQKKSPNTFDAHRIIWLAGKEGKQIETAEAFFKAYFEEGTDLTLRENLVKTAVTAGLDANKVNQLLDSDQGVAEVKERELFNRQAGVTGVPFYVINNKYGESGAQPVETFVRALSEIASETSTESEGPACDVDSNC